MNLLPIGTIVEHNEDINPRTGKLYQGEITPPPIHSDADMGLRFLDSELENPYPLRSSNLEKWWHVADMEPED